MINKFIKIFTLVFLYASLPVKAIEINSMFMVADSDGSGVFTIKNTNENRIFLNVAMFELEISEDNVQKIPYTRENLKDWKIDVRPAKTIIEPGQEKDFKVTMKCGANCEKDKEQLFQLGFVPTPYFDPSLHAEQAVQMAIGFGALFLNPAEDQPIDFDASYIGDTVKIHNKGSSYLKAKVSTCPPNTKVSESSACTKIVNVMPSRTLQIALPEEMQKQSVELHLDTNQDKYSQHVRLIRG